MRSKGNNLIVSLAPKLKTWAQSQLGDDTL